MAEEEETTVSGLEMSDMETESLTSLQNRGAEESE